MLLANLAAHTLHGPVDYKLNELGEWSLNDTLPISIFYP